MADVWGLMPKSQDDPETIEEAITRIVTAHNDDYEAHTGAGQSIDVHRNSEVIDHLAISVVADKIKNGELSLEKMSNERMFSQVDLTILNDTNYFNDSFGSAFYGEISNYGTVNTWHGGYFGGDQQFNLLGDPTKNPVFRFRCLQTDDVYAEAYFGIGDMLGDSALGFKLDNGTVKGVWWDDTATEHLITISGIDLTLPHNYSVIVKNAESVQYIIDGVVKYTLSWPSNIAINGGNTGMSAYTRYTTSGHNSVLILYQILFEQDFI